jgi:retinol dehydrogenase 12
VNFEHRPWLGGWPSYSQSKLANILFTRELARRLKGTGVTVNAVHPGFVASGFGHNSGWLNAFLVGIGQIAARSSVKGAETIVYLATSPEVEAVTGEYFFDLKPKTPNAAALDDGNAQRLWGLTEKLLAAH